MLQWLWRSCRGLLLAFFLREENQARSEADQYDPDYEFPTWRSEAEVEWIARLRVPKDADYGVDHGRQAEDQRTNVHLICGWIKCGIVLLRETAGVHRRFAGEDHANRAHRA